MPLVRYVGILGACMALVFTVGLSCLILGTYWDIARWENAIAAKGVVTGVANDSRPALVHYMYRDRYGVEHSGSTPPGFVPEDSKQGDEIDLFYLPHEPENSRLALPSWDGVPRVAVLGGLMALFFGVAAACLNFGAAPEVVNGRLVLVRKNELAEDYFSR